MMTDEFLEGPFNGLALRPDLGQPLDLLDQCWIHGHRNPRHGAPHMHHGYTPKYGASSIPYRQNTKPTFPPEVTNQLWPDLRLVLPLTIVHTQRTFGKKRPRQRMV